MGKIWRGGLAARPRPTHLPIIIPVVLHHSDTGWRTSTTFEAMFGEVPAPLLAYTPKFSFALDDLSVDSEEVLMQRATSAISRLALSALQDARSGDLLEFLPRWATLVLDVLREPNGMRALRLVFRYLSEVRGDTVASLDEVFAPA